MFNWPLELLALELISVIGGSESLASVDANESETDSLNKNVRYTLIDFAQINGLPSNYSRRRLDYILSACNFIYKHQQPFSR